MTKLSSLLLSLVLVLIANSFVLACACCAEAGTYSVWTNTITDYENELLKEMKFGKLAEFYMTNADWDETKGLGELLKEWQTDAYEAPSLVDVYANNVWRFDFRSRGGKVGSLMLPRPIKLTTRRVHIPDNTSTGPNVSLYKEFIFNGTVRSGSGFFKNGIIRPTTYTLLFQGRGNNCDNAEDFTNWRLEVSGKRANYVFFGKMVAGEKQVSLDTAL